MRYSENGDKKRLVFRQVFYRIDRFPLITDFEVQLDPIAVCIAHFGNLLTPFYLLFFLDQNLVVMSVSRQNIVTVLDDNQIAVTVHAAFMQNRSIGCGQDLLPPGSSNIDTPVLARCKRSNDFSLSRPAPANVFDFFYTTG